MADPNPLNDSELERLEQQLGRMTLSPTPRRRERLLYACGRAAGRAEMVRRLRAATALAAVLTCVSAGLCFALVTRKSWPANPVAQAQAPRFDERRPGPGESDVGRGKPPWAHADGRVLTAAMSFEDLLWSERRLPTQPSRAEPPGLALKRVLTVAGPFALADRGE